MNCLNNLNKIRILTAVFFAVISFITFPLEQAVAATTSTSLLKPATTWTTYKNLRYSNATSSSSNLLDVYVPNNGVAQAPLIVYIHGGGWLGGTKDQDCMAYTKQLMKKGYVVACINYRLSQEAIWPAQIIDVKTAIRGLRANAAALHIYPTKIGVWGGSAGGHLAVMAGLTGNKTEWDNGEWPGYSSAVQAVNDDFGPTELTSWVKDPCCAVMQSVVSQLIGAPVLSNPDKTASASPLTYVAAGAPPISISHGTKDAAVPVSQSQKLYDALKATGNPTTITILPGLTHADANFYTTTRINTISTFFDAYLRP